MLNIRKRVTNWFRDCGQEDIQITEQHAAFKEILDKTLDILRPFIKTNRRKKATEATAEDFHAHTHILQDNLSNHTINETVKSQQRTKPTVAEDDNAEESVEENGYTFFGLPRVHIKRDKRELEVEVYFEIMTFLVEIQEIGDTILDI
ncbi:hypothetical protein Ptr902_06175 [Pyrenophora tritici-repentis]|nr:hypothetical protein Ptr902_06175 [Pyrenophora tritici-repentis]